MLGTIDDSFLYSILEGLARGDSAAVLAIAEDMRSRSIGFDGALSVEWEDPEMDREHGAAEAAAFVRRLDFPAAGLAFDAAFSKTRTR